MNKGLQVFFLLLLSACAITFHLKAFEERKNLQETALPKMPFKKSLILTSVLLFSSSCKDIELVESLTSKMSNYIILESRAEKSQTPLRATRKLYKQTVLNLAFKDEEELLKVIQQIKEDAGEMTSHPIEELQRDTLIRFDKDASPIIGSTRYAAILSSAQRYQAQHAKLIQDPLFEELQAARDELKPLMSLFLRQNYTTLEQLQEAFNAPVDQVNVFLRALQASNKPH